MTINTLRSSVAAIVIAFILCRFLFTNSRRNLRYVEHEENSASSAVEIEKKMYPSFLSPFSDPSHTEIKAEQQIKISQQASFTRESMPADAAGNSRPLNILSFGGSVTWGATVSNRFEQAYPKLIGAPNFDHVDNFSIRATGSEYPSLCLESILSEAQIPPDQSYDIIFVEFVLNGMKGLPRLLHRLKHRYPDAVIVVVQLWSVFADVRERGTGHTVHELGKNRSVDWVWRDREGIDGYLQDIKAFIFQQIQGYIYDLPKLQMPIDVFEKGWFADDWQHLSETGHEFLADDIIRFLTSMPDIVRRMISNEKRVMAPESDDQCYKWFDSGQLPSPPDFYYEGAALHDIISHHPNESKWLLEFSPGGGLIKFHSKFSFPVPLTLAYMTRQDPAEYSTVEVTINGANPIVLNPNENSALRMPKAHIVSLTEIGWAVPGENVVTIKSLEERKFPFRIAGIIMEGGDTDALVGAMAKPSYSINLPDLGGCGQQQAILEIYRSPIPSFKTVIFFPGVNYFEHDVGIDSIDDYIAEGYNTAIVYYTFPRDPLDRNTACFDKVDKLATLHSAMEHVREHVNGGTILHCGTQYLLSWLPSQ